MSLIDSVHEDVKQAILDMNLPNIAVVAGGYSGEYSVSLRSASGILSWIDCSAFSPYLVVVEREGWYVHLEEGSEPIPVNKDDFSFLSPTGRIRFDYAFITVHGTPGENGLLQGYLDLVGVPYNTGGVLTEALTFSKYHCNRYLASFPHLRVADSVRLRHDMPQPSSHELVERLGLPLFAKPNAGGSSVATSRVDTEAELERAIREAFTECDEVLLERFIAGV